MADEFLTLDFEGLPEWVQLTEDMQGRIEDLTPVFNFLHEVWIGQVREQFETEGQHFLGEKWEPLSPAYAAWKEKNYPNMPILQRTRRLIRSLTEESHPEHIAEIGPDSAVFGTEVPYGRYHQAGSERLPRRQVLAVRDAMRRVAFRATLAYVVTGRAPRGVDEAGE